MRALLFEDGLRLAEVPKPIPQPDEALIKVLTAGICNTDLEIMRGYMGFQGIPGHEFVGIVEEAPISALVGKRIVGEINCVCNRCHYCQLELPNHCLDRSVLGIHQRNGAFAEYLCLPVDNLHLAPPSVRDDVAVFAEPLAAAFRIMEQINIIGERVIVLGDGKLGQLIAQAIAMYTLPVDQLLCVGKHAWKLALLQDLGIATAHANDPVERGADVVVEATGSPEGFARALELVRPEGTIILKSTVSQPTAFDLSLPVINEVKIIGSRCGPFRPALEALALGNVEVRPLISHSYSLEEGVEALRRAGDPDVMKVLLHM